MEPPPETGYFCHVVTLRLQSHRLFRASGDPASGNKAARGLSARELILQLRRHLLDLLLTENARPRAEPTHQPCLVIKIPGIKRSDAVSLSLAVTLNV